MRKTILIAIVPTLFVLKSNAQNNGTAINITGAQAHPSAVLDISSTNQGVLIPRMTEGERLSLPFLSTGLLVYQIDGITGFWFYDGALWKQFPSTGTAPGDLPYWDGSQWTMTPAGQSGDFLQFTGSGVPGWAAGATPP